MIDRHPIQRSAPAIVAGAAGLALSLAAFAEIRLLEVERTLAPWVGLGTGAIFTVALVAFLVRQAHRSLMIESLVEERTVDLRERNDELKREMAERKRAESERQRLEAQIRQSQKLETLGALAGGIAHDFNNLLTAIMGNANLALMDLPTDSPARSHLQDIESASLRAEALCRQLLAYSGKGRFARSSFNLTEVVIDLRDAIEATVNAGIQIVFDLETEIPPVKGDAGQFRQLVLNLATNAWEAMEPSGGVMRVATGVVHCDRRMLDRIYLKEDLAEGDYVFLDVEDTGPGMNEATISQIFDPFFTTKFPGRGLGLAQVLGIVRGHRGGILVESWPGKGAYFRILFPPQAPANIAPSKTPERIRTQASGGTILVVEDELPVRDLARRMLERSGYWVLTANDGFEGVEVFRQKQAEISAVLLDLTMPRMDGREALREMRRLNPNTPIVMASGYLANELDDTLDVRKPEAFIAKPYRAEELNKALKSVLSK